MKAVVATTRDDKYLFYLPICTWVLNKMGIGVVCFIPIDSNLEISAKSVLIDNILYKNHADIKIHKYIAPIHKEATYAQCLRNYASALPDLDENELLVSCDIDMVLLKRPPYNDKLTIWGNDLVPQGQFPQCYITGTVKQWREAFNINNRTYQQCIDDLLAEDECEHYKGNRWSVDQEQSFLNISKFNHSLVPRARQGTQFAEHRLDRDDSYILDRLNEDNIDYHMNRPGYEEKNFDIILKVLQYHYPNEDFTWLKTYYEAYKELL